MLYNIDGIEESNLLKTAQRKVFSSGRKCGMIMGQKPYLYRFCKGVMEQ